MLIACLLGLCPAAPAFAQDAAGGFGSFEDVPLDHWAFLTVETLVRKYKVMAGFPDGTFGGGREVSRYELAAALDKVLQRMKMPASGVTKTDVEAVEAVSAELNLTGLADRVKKFEEDLNAATTKGPAGVKISGGTGATWIDNTQDTVNPYMKVGLGLGFDATVGDFQVSTGMYGDMPATATGNKPGTAGGGKPPSSDWKMGGTKVSTRLFDTNIRVGRFGPKEFYGSGPETPSKWGGIVGNGFIGTNVNSVRWGDSNSAIAAKREFGPVAVTAAVTPTVLLAGLRAQIFDWLVVKAGADTDQPDWWNVTPNRTTANNFTGSVDVSQGPFALGFQGNYAKNLIRGSAQFTWAIVGATRLSLGAVYKESEKAVTELTPGASLFFPSYDGFYAPTVLFGLKEPQILSATDPNIQPGPGSLLGEQAGFSAVFEWDLEEAGLPSVTAEYNIQQPVLLYSIYDATFALSVSRGF